VTPFRLPHSPPSLSPSSLLDRPLAHPPFHLIGNAHDFRGFHVSSLGHFRAGRLATRCSDTLPRCSFNRFSFAEVLTRVAVPPKAAVLIGTFIEAMIGFFSVLSFFLSMRRVRGLLHLFSGRRASLVLDTFKGICHFSGDLPLDGVIFSTAPSSPPCPLFTRCLIESGGLRFLLPLYD